jgi:predicted house-cleaning NTP pyrophosphatase (Maf/HAM1 superfamily)
MSSWAMATLMQRLQKFLQSPKGQQMVRKGQEQMAKPENQARARKLLARFQGKRR